MSKKESPLEEEKIRTAIVQHLKEKTTQKRVHKTLEELMDIAKKGLSGKNPTFGLEFMVALSLLIDRIKHNEDLNMFWDIINSKPEDMIEHDYIG